MGLSNRGQTPGLCIEDKEYLGLLADGFVFFSTVLRGPYAVQGSKKS